MTTIGILTYLKEYSNLGTNMQSYCTLRSVQREYPGATVELLDYAPYRPLARPYLSHVSFASLMKDYRRIIKYRQFFKNHLSLSREQLVSGDLTEALEFIRRQRYDALYVGADTVLELTRAGDQQLTAYWLDKSIDSAKFLLAASSHNVTFDAISDAQREQIQRTIDDFALLGVRDDATFRLMSHFTPHSDPRLEVVPDPTFTYDIDYGHIERYLKRQGLTFDKPVVCLHLLRHCQWASGLARLFKDNGYVVASLRPARYADVLLTDLSPFEQMGVYRYFALMITHRFHDAIFCLKNLTPVIAFPEHLHDVTSHGESKIQTLLKSFGLDTTHYIADKSSITAATLFDVHHTAMTLFHQKTALIRSVLRGNRERYESFLAKSRRFLN